MLIKLRNTVALRLLWFLLAIYFFNISIDFADPEPNYIVEDLSFNDQESIVEFVLEKVLGFEDAIQEYDDNDSEEKSVKKSVKIDLFRWNILSDNYSKINGNSSSQSLAVYLQKTSCCFIEIDSPPPQV